MTPRAQRTSIPARRPAETATFLIAAALASKAGVDGQLAQALALTAVGVAPAVVTVIVDHGIKGAALRLWRGTRTR